MRACTYRLKVEGEFVGDVEYGLGILSHGHEDGNTVFWGPVRDQAELHGLLQRLADLGMTILSVEAIFDDS